VDAPRRVPFDLVLGLGVRVETEGERQPNEDGRLLRRMRFMSGYRFLLMSMFLLLPFFVPSTARAVEHDIRRFEETKALMHRRGPDLGPLLRLGNSYFMGVHFRQTRRHASEPHPLLTVADGAVGPHRYMRLEVFSQSGSSGTPNAINFVAKTEGRASGGDSVMGLSVGSAISLNQWYAAGVLVEPESSGWRITLFKQRHGGVIEEVRHIAADLDYEIGGQRLEIYSIARHRFTTGSSETDAHQYFGDIVAPVWVLNPSRGEIEAFMGRTDPGSIWSSSSLLVQPDLATLRDAVDGLEWTLGDAADSSLIGTLSLIAGDGSSPAVPEPNGEEGLQPPVAPTLEGVE